MTYITGVWGAERPAGPGAQPNPNPQKGLQNLAVWKSLRSILRFQALFSRSDTDRECDG